MKIKKTILSIVHQILLSIGLILIAVLAVNAIFNQILVATMSIEQGREVFFAVVALIFLAASALFWRQFTTSQIAEPRLAPPFEENQTTLVKNLLFVFAEGVLTGLLNPKYPHKEE